MSLLDTGKTCLVDEQAGTESFYLSICGIVRIPMFVFNRGSLILFEVGPKNVYVSPTSSGLEALTVGSSVSLSNSESLLISRFLWLSVPWKERSLEETRGDWALNKF